MAILKHLSKCKLNKHTIYKNTYDVGSDERVICYADFFEMETDIVDSFGINILNVSEPYTASTTQPLEVLEGIYELLPYISYVQSKFDDYTYTCKEGKYYNKELDIHIRVRINANTLSLANKPPLEAFKMVKWFIEINTKKQVPEELKELIEQEQALELLKG